MSGSKDGTQLEGIEVASPCQARWEEMEGDEKVRFCKSCRLSVYNLSAMEVEEAAERILQDGDRLCVRFYRRVDGTVLTRDCPVGARASQGSQGAPAIHGTALTAL